jgi:hypothetical protein
MRDRHEIAHEMAEKREDLQEAFTELRQIVEDKLDVKARVREVVQIKGAQLEEAAVHKAAQVHQLVTAKAHQARQTLSQAEQVLKSTYYRVVASAKANPALAIGLAAAVVGTGVLIVRRARD